MSPNQEETFIIKYADDTAILGLITNNDESQYRSVIAEASQSFQENNLSLNTKKTKEMIFDFRTKPNVKTQVQIGSDVIKCVEEYEYLGLTINNKLDWTAHCKEIRSTCNSRLFLLRNLRKSGVSSHLLNTFYESIILSIISYCLPVFYWPITVNNSDLIEKIIVQSSRIVGRAVKTPEVVLVIATNRFASKIQSDISHPLFHYYRRLPSGRLASILARTDRYGKTVVPSSIRLLNSL